MRLWGWETAAQAQFVGVLGWAVLLWIAREAEKCRGAFICVNPLYRGDRDLLIETRIA